MAGTIHYKDLVAVVAYKRSRILGEENEDNLFPYCRFDLPNGWWIEGRKGWGTVEGMVVWKNPGENWTWEKCPFKKEIYEECLKLKD